MAADFEDIDAVPDPSSYDGPDVRALDYDDIQGGERIGSGGFARVSVVTVDGRQFVVKEPIVDGTVETDTMAEFVDEAETWSQLDDHAHVVSVVDWGDRLPWIALEYMDGDTLADRLEAGRLDTAQALWTGVCLSRALQHAHRHGIVHLDLTPDNVLFRATSDGVWDLPKIGDWGLSESLLEQSETVDGLTPNYAAPEQFDPEAFGKPDDFTDRFQLATVVYEALTGKRAFPGSGMAAMRRVTDGDVTPPTSVDPDLPDALDEIFARALATEKSERYETVVNFRRDLASVFETVVEESDRTAGATGDTSETVESQHPEAATPPSTEPHAEASGADRDRPTTLYEGIDDIDGVDASDAALLLDTAELEIDGEPADDPLRLAVSDTFSVDGETHVSAAVASGTLSRDDRLVFEPGGAELSVGTMEAGLSGTAIETATAGDSVTLVPDAATDRDDIRRGALGSRRSSAPKAVDSFEAELYVLDHPSVITAGYTPVVHTHTGQVAASITGLTRRVMPVGDHGTWEIERTPDYAEPGDIVQASLSPQRPFAVDPIDEAPETGWFTVRDAGQVVAIGAVTAVEPAARPASTPEDDLVDRLTDCAFAPQDHVERLAAQFEDATVPAAESAPLRLPIQDAYTLSDAGTVLTGDVVAGTLEGGDDVWLRPADVAGAVETIEQNHEAIAQAGPGETVAFQVGGTEQDEVRRGAVCGPLDGAPPVADRLRARIVITDHPSVVTAGYTPVVHAHTAQVACTIDSIEATVDPDDGRVIEERPDFIQNGDTAEVVLEPQKPLSVEPITDVPELGVFSIRDMGQTVGVGGVIDVTEE